MLRAALAALALLAGAAHAPAQPVAGSGEDAAPEVRYGVTYEFLIAPSERTARVSIRVDDPQDGLLSIRFAHDPERQIDFRGDGEVLVEEAWVAWTPPRYGGTLRYTVRLEHLRDEQSYDARVTRTWALFRGDDLVPPARVRTDRMAHADARLRLRLPEGWSAVVPYPRRSDGTYEVEHPHRRFDRPTGWMLAGHLGVLRERVSGTLVAIGAPVGHGMRRHDMMAMLRWTLPQLKRIAPLPERLVLVGAGDPMWRGGLSGPRSAYLHASLPLISNDGTSPLLHEVVHVWMGARSGPGGDAIVEGLAELYGLEAMVRSKTISRRRYERSLAKLAEKGRGVRSITAVEKADARVTARAVGLLVDLDQRIREATDGAKSLDDVVRRLVDSNQAISLDHFRDIVTDVAGQPLDTFFSRRELARR